MSRGDQRNSVDQNDHSKRERRRSIAKAIRGKLQRKRGFIIGRILYSIPLQEIRDNAACSITSLDMRSVCAQPIDIILRNFIPFGCCQRRRCRVLQQTRHRPRNRK